MKKLNLRKFDLYNYISWKMIFIFGLITLFIDSVNHKIVWLQILCCSILLYLLFLTIRKWIKKHTTLPYLQQGPTCCFYAVGKVKALLYRTRPDKKETEALIHKCIDEQFTQIGEVFSMNKLQRLTRFVGLEAKIETVKNNTAFTKLLASNYLLYFVKSNDTVHCLLLRRKIGPFVWYWEGVNGTHLLPIHVNALLAKNREIPALFHWDEWYQQPHTFNKKHQPLEEFLQKCLEEEKGKRHAPEPLSIKGSAVIISKKMTKF